MSRPSCVGTRDTYSGTPSASARARPSRVAAPKASAAKLTVRSIATGLMPATVPRTSTCRPPACQAGSARTQSPGPPSRSSCRTAAAVSACRVSSAPLGSPVEPPVGEDDGDVVDLGWYVRPEGGQHRVAPRVGCRRHRQQGGSAVEGYGQSGEHRVEDLRPGRYVEHVEAGHAVQARRPLSGAIGEGRRHTGAMSADVVWLGADDTVEGGSRRPPAQPVAACGPLPRWSSSRWPWP